MCMLVLEFVILYKNVWRAGMLCTEIRMVFVGKLLVCRIVVKHIKYKLLITFLFNATYKILKNTTIWRFKDTQCS